MRRRLAGLLAVVALVAGACGDDDDETAGTATGAGEEAGAQTYEIGVDAKSEEFATSWIHFFPNEIKAHPGDTIEFTSVFTGEPHSVAAGTLIDEAVEAFSKLPEGEEGPPPPEIQAILEKIPFVFNEEAEGPDDPIFLQGAGQPCYLETGDPPTKEACPKDKQEAPGEFTGKERFLSSGFMPDEDKETFKLADDIAPGTYTFMCLVHGPDMVEEVTVVAEGTKVPSPDEVKAEAKTQLDEFVAKVKPDADKILTSTSKDAPAGAFPESEDVPSAGVNVFPANIPVKVGEKVTWTITGGHTISFNAPEDARPWVQFSDTGELVMNEKSPTPADSPPIPDPPEAPEGEGGGGGGGEEGPPPQLKVDGGTYDGQGFKSSGLPLGDGQLVYSLGFSKAGTYTYLCLLHPDMEGTVTVT